MIKAYIITANWLLAFLLLSYNGISLIFAFMIVFYFCFSSWLLMRNKSQIMKIAYRLNEKIDKIIIPK